MTLREAVNQLRAKDPTRTFSAQKDEWAYADGLRDRTEYSIGALPGINGVPCSRWAGSTLEQPLAEALAALTPPTPIEATANEE